MNTEEIRQQFFTCECYGDAIQTMKFDDEDLIYFSIWYQGPHRKVGWKHKLKYIWRILTNGSPYGDQVILSKQKSKQLANWLLKHSRDNEAIELKG